MKQTQGRAKDLFFFPKAKPRPFSTLTCNLHVSYSFYEKGRDCSCQSFGGRWLGEVSMKTSFSLWPLPPGNQHMGQKYTSSHFPPIPHLLPSFPSPSPSLHYCYLLGASAGLARGERYSDRPARAHSQVREAGQENQQ